MRCQGGRWHKFSAVRHACWVCTMWQDCPSTRNLTVRQSCSPSGACDLLQIYTDHIKYRGKEVNVQVWPFGAVKTNSMIQRHESKQEWVGECTESAVRSAWASSGQNGGFRGEDHREQPGNLQCRKPKETELIPRKTKPNKEGSKHLMGSHIVKRFLLWDGLRKAKFNPCCLHDRQVQHSELCRILPSL